MAEGLFRKAVEGRGDYRVLSAGLGALDGQPPSAHSVAAMKELGIDITKQRSRMLTAELVLQADYIFGMTHSHVDTVQLLYPKAFEKTFLLREFDDTLDPYEKDISDPIGGSLAVYRHCRDQIEQGIAGILHFVEHGRSPIEKSARLQDRVTPVWRRALGGCHLNRPIPALIEGAGFRMERLDTYRDKGPELMARLYEGVAVRA